MVETSITPTPPFPFCYSRPRRYRCTVHTWGFLEQGSSAKSGYDTPPVFRGSKNSMLIFMSCQPVSVLISTRVSCQSARLARRCSSVEGRKLSYRWIYVLVTCRTADRLRQLFSNAPHVFFVELGDLRHKHSLVHRSTRSDC